jgi:hypothetical protein
LFRNSTADGAVHIMARWLRRSPPRGDQPTTGRGLLLHAVRHLHPDGEGIKSLRGYAAGGPCQFVHSYDLERSNLRWLRQ